MATRRTTLLYGEKPAADIHARTQADDDATADTLVTPPVRLLPTIELRAAHVPETLPQPRPMYPTTSPWRQPRSLALITLALGVAAAGAVFAGLAILAISMAWSHQITLLAQLGLMALGGYLVSAGVAYVATFEDGRSSCSGPVTSASRPSSTALSNIASMR